MKRERNLMSIATVMFVLNFSTLCFYSLICVTITYRICGTLGAHDFLTLVRQMPPYPWRMLLQSLSLYALLCAVSFFKIFRPMVLSMTACGGGRTELTNVLVNNGKIDVMVYELPPVVVTKDNAKEVFTNDPGRLELLK